MFPRLFLHTNVSPLISWNVFWLTNAFHESIKLVNIFLWWIMYIFIFRYRNLKFYVLYLLSIHNLWFNWNLNILIVPFGTNMIRKKVLSPFVKKRHSFIEVYNWMFKNTNRIIVVKKLFKFAIYTLQVKGRQFR